MCVYLCESAKGERESCACMEYMEIPTIPKVVLDNLLASVGSPATMKEGAPHSRQNNGYGPPLSMPLFHGATMRSPAMPTKTTGASLPPLPGGLQRRESCASPPGTLFKDCVDPLAVGGPVGLPPSVKEKPKRVRKSRAGMTPKKRGISDLVLDANLDGAQQPPQVSPPKRRRKSVGDAENTEKPPPRKRNRSKAKVKDEHALSSSTNETSFSHSDPNPSKGILGVYGLETKALDLTRYMKDISIERLLAGDFNMPSLPPKQGPPPGSVVDNSFGSHVNSVLQNLTRSTCIDQPRPASLLFSKPTESKPPKFSFDLESTPLDESEELGGNMFDNKINAPCYEAPTTFLQSRKTQDASSLFTLETIPVIPPADFWNSLQIHPNVSLNSLITQASAASDSRFFPSEVGSTCDNSSTLPPSIFSLGSTQVLQESACDRLASSKLNHWFRAESPKQDFPGAFPASISQGNKFPFKLDVKISTPTTKLMEKPGLKEGLFDIDLNKQSPEAEAAETIAHSTSVALSRPEAAHVSPRIVQARIDTDNIDSGSLPEHKGTDVDLTVAVKEAEATCNIDSVMDGEVVGDVSKKGPSLPQDSDMTGKLNQGSSSVFVNREDSFEQVKDASMNTAASLPTLLVPDAPEIQDVCNDVPYSPGMQATARLLCRMAISSSPFYVEKDDKDDDDHVHATVSCNDTSFERPAKAAKVICTVEKDRRAHKSPALHDSQDKEYTHRGHTKDGKEKLLYSQMVSNSTLVTDKANGSEPWASTPPRHAPKNVASRVSAGSQSSESDRSLCHGSRERTLNGNHGNTNKMQRDQQHVGTAAFSRVSSALTRKDSKGNHTPVSKTSLLHVLPIKGASVSTTQKKSLACEMKVSLTSHGEGGLTKISRPRSNTSKNCLQVQRSTNGFPVQPRNLNGCSIKSPSSRHVLPYVGEVRHGSK